MKIKKPQGFGQVWLAASLVAATLLTGCGGGDAGASSSSAQAHGSSGSAAGPDKDLVAMLPQDMRGKTFTSAALFQPPYMIQDSEGKLTTGIDIDLYKEFEKRLGIKISL